MPVRSFICAAIAKKEDLAGISNVEDALVSFCHFWIDEHSPIERYDAETGDIFLPEWQEKYGFDFGSRIEKPADEILKLVGADGKP